MFSDSLELTLKAIKDGTELTIHVHPLTLAMKGNLDEWLRYRFIKRAHEDGEDMATAEAIAEGLDILYNNWAVPSLVCGARTLWEMCKPGMSFATFEKTYFNASYRDLKSREEMQERFAFNQKTIAEAIRYATENPTENNPPSSVEEPQTANG